MIEIFGIEYPEIDGERIELSNGVVIIRREHELYKLIQSKTGIIFDSADDLEDSEFRYGITEIIKSGMESDEPSPEDLIGETIEELSNEPDEPV